MIETGEKIDTVEAVIMIVRRKEMAKADRPATRGGAEMGQQQKAAAVGEEGVAGALNHRVAGRAGTGIMGMVPTHRLTS